MMGAGLAVLRRLVQARPVRGSVPFTVILCAFSGEWHVTCCTSLRSSREVGKGLVSPADRGAWGALCRCRLAACPLRLQLLPELLSLQRAVSILQ